MAANAEEAGPLLEADGGGRRGENGKKDAALDEELTPNEKRMFRRNWFGFFIMGMINNLVYVIVASAAKSIADSFGKSNLIGLITWANVGLGLLAGSVNTFFLALVPYPRRIIANAVLSTVGLIGVAFAPSFWFALVAIVVSGASSSFGESVTLGFMRLFPSRLVNAWSAGTGMAGVGGSALYLLYRSVDLSLRDSFLVTLPWVAVYLTGFFLVLYRVDAEEKAALMRRQQKELRLQEDEKRDQKKRVELGSSAADVVNESAGARGRHTSYGATPTGDTSFVGAGDAGSGGKELVAAAGSGSYDMPLPESTFGRLRRCFRYFRWPAINLVLVYFFEYVISSGFAAKVLTPEQDCRFSEKGGCELADHCRWSETDKTCESTVFLRKNAYAIFSFCYQFGVLFSRSSLQFFKIKRIEVLTLLQGINFLIWLLQADLKYMGLWALFPLMVFVGLLGGASYVNVFYILLHDPKIPEKDREFCINLAAMSSTVGITLAGCFILTVDATFLSSK